jgi:hypothetical protein
MVKVNESLSRWFVISVAQALNSATVSPLPSNVEHSVLRRGKKIVVPGVVHVRTSPVCPLVPPLVVTSPAVPTKNKRFPFCIPRSQNSPVVSVKGLPTSFVSIEKAQFHHSSPNAAIFRLIGATLAVPELLGTWRSVGGFTRAIDSPCGVFDSYRLLI